MFRSRHRSDNGHFEWVRALRKVTVVIDIHNGPLGADVLALHLKTKAPMFLEFKSSEKAKLTSKEIALGALFPDHWRRVNSLEEALAAVGAG